MKATGIIRRIDDLGRVVIPKELRRTLNIQVGDPLEIFTSNDTIIFKKYSPLDSMRQNAQTYANAVYDVLQCTVVVCDKDFVVSVAGPDQREVMGRRLTTEMESLESFFYNDGVRTEVKPFEGIDKYILAGAMIMTSNDRYGFLLLLTDDPKQVASEAEISSVKVGADYLGRQISI